ncbi:hypothetical protein CXF72_13170 [Psychromonas sp. MB-3u-54]|uniref:hypothetical protein n=1 Tax=Psychromonas sp. MB-3u-54 TaxID=2058319 RepID=UPI000C3241AB|nr:hypothetical protein [Psychromonas sp. MB-3u-54]PKH02150.1 hypothetical protein CXF72_13170 [Psychromonas sp. MB-3u-54]
MSKLFKKKEWLTLDQAVIHISNVLSEPFTLANIYEFALSGDLVLSVNFENIVKAKKVTFIKKEDIKYKKVFPKNLPNIPEGGYFNVPINAKHPISRDCWVENIEEQVVSLSGVWDLSMIGTEKFSIKQLYQQEISSDIEVKVPEALSVYVKGAEDTYQLQLLLTMAQYREQHNNLTVNGLKPKIADCALAYPASRLDERDYILVVRVKEVTRFIQSLEDSPQEDKPLHDKERTTLLLLFGSMLKKANFDLNERGVTGKIRRATESNNTPISEQTIRDLLPYLRDTIELKKK